jgi:hypothetical protein
MDVLRLGKKLGTEARHRRLGKELGTVRTAFWLFGSPAAERG